MRVSELISQLTNLDPTLDIVIDVDDGVKGSYKDVLGIRVVLFTAGEIPFVAIDADYAEPRRGIPVQPRIGE